MTWQAWTFLVLFISTASLFIYTVRRAIYLDELLESILEELKKNLEVLKIVLKNVEYKSTLSVFSDEPIVRDLIDDIKAARSTVFITLNTARDFLAEHEVEVFLDDDNKEKNHIEK